MLRHKPRPSPAGFFGYWFDPDCLLARLYLLTSDPLDDVCDWCCFLSLEFSSWVIGLLKGRSGNANSFRPISFPNSESNSSSRSDTIWRDYGFLSSSWFLPKLWMSKSFRFGELLFEPRFNPFGPFLSVVSWLAPGPPVAYCLSMPTSDIVFEWMGLNSGSRSCVR